MTERIGQYELLDKFAEGGMAEIWFGRIVGAEGFVREVAVKRLLPSGARDPEVVAMFLDEARLGATLHHPNIVSVLDLGGLGDDWFLVMELVDGPHLGKLFAHSLRTHRPLPWHLCAAIVAAAAEGLHFAHDRVDPLTGASLAIVHRDISPQNILISRFGDVKITDFGVAQARSHRLRTRSGVVKGKLGYLAPEQCRNLPVDRRTDVFSLGIVLYELLTRRRLYRGDAEFDVMRRICEEEPLPPGVVCQGVDPALGEIALRALRKEPGSRYQTAGELSDALYAWLRRHGHGDWRHALGFWVRRHAAPVWPALEQRMLRWAELQGGDTTPTSPSQRTSASLRPLPRALPAEHDPFVGRRHELEALRARMADGARWLTVRGTAGVGKSRLVLRLARIEVAAGREVVHVPLASVDQPGGLVAAVAHQLGLGGQSLEDSALAEVLRRAGPLWLILDDADRVRAWLGDLVGPWLERCPTLQVIVTSRRAARDRAETVWELPPMPVPEAEDPGDSEAAALLLARVRERRPGWRLPAAERPALAALLRRLDGLPLALEMAAARLEVLEPSELLSRLDSGLQVLRGDGARHGDTGLRDVLAAVICELTPAARRMLGRATVFAGAFDSSAADQVLAADDERGEVVATLETLRDHGLLLVEELAIGPRLRMLHALRDVADELVDAADREATRARWRFWLRNSADALLARAGHRGASDAALRLAAMRADLLAATSAWPAAEGAAPPAWDPDLEAIITARAWLAQRQGPRSDVVPLLRSACASARADGASAGRLAHALVRALAAEGDLGEARRTLEELHRDTPWDGRALATLGSIALQQGRPAEAAAAAERAEGMCRAASDRDGLAQALLVRAAALAAEEATDRLVEAAVAKALDAARAVGDAVSEAAALCLKASQQRLPAGAAAARVALVEALERTECLGDMRLACRVRTLSLLLALAEEGTADREATMAAAARDAEAAGDAALRADVAWIGALIDLRAGRSADGAIARALSAATSCADAVRVAWAYALAAVAARSRGAQDEAAVAIDAAVGWHAPRATEPWNHGISATLAALQAGAVLPRAAGWRPAALAQVLEPLGPSAPAQAATQDAPPGSAEQ